MSGSASVNDQNWEAEVMQAGEPVLVDFWAPWCGPCRALSPTVDAVAQELAGRLKVVKCNTDEAHAVATKFNVMSIPTLLLFKEGRVVAQMLGGNLRKDEIRKQVEPHLA